MNKAVVLVSAALLLAGCSPERASAGTIQLTIEKPASGASVMAPFTVVVQTTTVLGPEASGNQHVHVYLDDQVSEYVIARSNEVRITQAAPGSHVLHVSLHNANHSPAGVAAQIPITVVAGAAGPPAGPR